MPGDPTDGYQPDIDPRIGPHPFMDRTDGLEPWPWCALTGCGRVPMDGIHSSAPEGSRVRELAKAVDRMYTGGHFMLLPEYAGNITFELLHFALEQEAARGARCLWCGRIGEHDPTCDREGVMARYQAEGR